MLRALPLVLLIFAAGCADRPPVVVESYRTSGDYTTGTLRNTSGQELRNVNLIFGGAGSANLGTIADGVSVPFRVATFGFGGRSPSPTSVFWDGGSYDFPATDTVD